MTDLVLVEENNNSRFSLRLWHKRPKLSDLNNCNEPMVEQVIITSGLLISSGDRKNPQTKQTLLFQHMFSILVNRRSFPKFT